MGHAMSATARAISCWIEYKIGFVKSPKTFQRSQTVWRPTRRTTKRPTNFTLIVHAIIVPVNISHSHHLRVKLRLASVNFDTFTIPMTLAVMKKSKGGSNNMYWFNVIMPTSKNSMFIKLWSKFLISKSHQKWCKLQQQMQLEWTSSDLRRSQKPSEQLQHQVPYKTEIKNEIIFKFSVQVFRFFNSRFAFLHSLFRYICQMVSQMDMYHYILWAFLIELWAFCQAVDEHQRKKYGWCTNFPFCQSEFHPN